MFNQLLDPASIPNGDQTAGSASYKCTGNCQNCLCDKFNLQFYFTDDEGTPYADMEYIASFEDGTEKQGVTDYEGKTECFSTDSKQQILVHLANKQEKLFE